MSSANPISGPYINSGSVPYHTNYSMYSRSVLATGPFIATGAYANPSAIWPDGGGGSHVDITLVNGGQMHIDYKDISSPFPVALYSVDSGSLYLLYR